MQRRNARRLRVNAARCLMIRLGVVQTPGTRLDEWREIRPLIEVLIARAAREGAELALLPECTWPAYYIESVTRYFAARSNGMPGPDEFLGWMRAAAIREHIAVCVGYVAERGGGLSNEVALISAVGELLGTHAKCFLWDFDNEFFKPGERLESVLTPWGSIGLMICADARLPEIPATLVSRGARLLLQPTAWVNVGTREAPWNPQPSILIPDRAREFGVPIASASKWGTEGPTDFVGSSLICDATGAVLARCGSNESDVIVAEVELGAPKNVRVTAKERQRLLSTVPAQSPRRDVPFLNVVFLPSIVESNACIQEDDSRAANSSDDITLVISEGIKGQEFRSNDCLLLGSADGKINELSGTRIASLTDSEAKQFAPCRSLALNGIHAGVVFGNEIGSGTLRTRAAENRIFIIHVVSHNLAVYSPLGIAVEPTVGTWCNEPNALIFRLNPGEAAKKEFASGTDPFRQRQPSMYEFK